MIRTQIQLTEKQADALRRRAHESRTSMAALIREAVDRLLGDDDLDARWQRAMAVVGKYHSGVGDVSERHDEYFADAVYDWHDTDDADAG